MEQKSQKLILGTVGLAGLFLAGGNTVSANTTHKVTQNDTVWGLSQKYGVSIKSIEELNHVDSESHLIFKGHTIQIPDKAAKATTKAAPKEKTPNATSTYEVKAGDSLWSIAQKYSTSVDHIRSLNALGTNSVIVPGQTLKIEGTAVKAATPAPKQARAQQASTEAKKATPVTPAKGSAPSVQPQQSQKAVQPSKQVETENVQQEESKQETPVAKRAEAPQAEAKAAPQQKIQASQSNSQSQQEAQPTKAQASSSSAQSQQEAHPAKTQASSSSAQSQQEAQPTKTQASSSSAQSQQEAQPAKTQASSNSDQSQQEAQPVKTKAVQNNAQAQSKVSANHSSHSVKSGESLFTIANDYGVTVASIREANALSSSALQVGQSLTINDPAKDPSAAKPAQNAGNKQQNTQKQPNTSASNNNVQQSHNSTTNVASKPQQSASNSSNNTQTTPAAKPDQQHGQATNVAGNTYAYGQCTWFAKNRASWAGNYWGNGGNWDSSARSQGFAVNNQPTAGSLVVFHPGQSVGGQWTADGSAGHVAYVESVSGNTVTISQGGMGFSNPGGPNYQTISNASQYTYIHP